MSEIPSGLMRDGQYVIEDPNDLNDYEFQQSIVEQGGPGTGQMDSVFSPGFSSAACADMYRGWVFPDIYPNQRQPVLSNWPAEDLEDFCGIINTQERI